jgi:hypothetical protein
MDNSTIWTAFSDPNSFIRQRYERAQDTLAPEDRLYLKEIFRVADGKMAPVLWELQRKLRENGEFIGLSRVRLYIPKLLLRTGILNQNEIDELSAREQPIDPYAIPLEVRKKLKERLDEQVARQKIYPQERKILEACLQIAAPHNEKDAEKFYRKLIPLLGVNRNGDPYTTNLVSTNLKYALEKILPEIFAATRRENVQMFDLLVETGKKRSEELHTEWALFARNGQIIRYAIQHASGYRNTTIEIVRNQFPQLSRNTIEKAIRDGIFHLFEEEEREKLQVTMSSGIWEAVTQSPEIIRAKLESGKVSGIRQEDRLRPLDKRSLQKALEIAETYRRQGKQIDKATLVELITRQEYGEQYITASANEQRAKRRTIDKVIRRSVNILYDRESYQEGERIKGWRWRTERNAIIRLMQNPDFAQFFSPHRRQRILGFIQKYYLEVPEGEQPPIKRVIAEFLGEPIDSSGFTQLTHDLEYIRHKILSPYMSNRILEGISAS